MKRQPQPQPPLLRRSVLTSTVWLITRYALNGEIVVARRKIDITKEYEELAKRDRAARDVEAESRFAVEVRAETEALAELLIQKNRAYGNSALDPVRIFSKADPAEQIRVRIDDKLSRLGRGAEAGEDVIQDLLGYLILLRIAKRREQEAQAGHGG